MNYDQYWRKGGDYVIPVEIFNDLIGELEQLQQENARLKDKMKDIEKILKSNHYVEYIYCALSQYFNIFDYELNLEDYLK